MTNIFTLYRLSLWIFFGLFEFEVLKTIKKQLKVWNLLSASRSAVLDSGALNHLDVLMIWVSDQKIVSAISPLVIACLGA